MSDVARATESSPPIWALPEARKAPSAFRTFLRIAASNWRTGGLEVITPDGARLRIEGDEPGPQGVLKVADYRFVGRVLAGGDIGFAEGYMAGEWDTPDLPALLETISRNLDQIRSLLKGNPLVRAVNYVQHLRRSNTRAQAKRNIHAHYDLGNAFYAQWLDETMTYSSARFERHDQPLAEAQRAKYASLARAMDLQAGHHVLEIGCGWGGFAEFAAGEVGARVTGVTISQAQYEFARKRLFMKGLADRTEIKLVDYRDVEGCYDRVASIEMFEAVGERWWPAYFATVRDRLAPGGRAALQIITIADRYFEEYLRRMDFIQKYIFPGGALPGETRLRQETDRAGLTWLGAERFGRSYAETLSQWADRFQAAWDQIRPLGFDERFRKLWLFYLAYCEAGFRTERTDVIQLSLAR